jgi:hypothetical protein
MLPLILFGAAYLIGRTTKEETEFANGGTTGAGSYAGGGMMAKGGIYSSDDTWVVTFQNQDTGEFEEVTVRANNKSNAIATAEDESGLSKDYKYYSVKKSMADGGMVRDEIRKFVIPYLKDEHNIEVDKSLNNGFNWFVPAISDELPDDFDDLSEKEQQEFGTHLATDKELIDFARELGYITDEEVFGEYADGGMMAKGGAIGKYELMPYTKGVGDLYNPKYQSKEFFEGPKNDAIDKANSMLSTEIAMIQVNMVNPKATNVLNKTKRIATIIYKDGGMMAKGGEIEEGDVVIVKSENLKAEVTNVGTDFITVEFIGKRPEGGDKRGRYKKSDLKKYTK